jgi:hypothetical protein
MTGKNLIFVAHEVVEKRGDDIRLVPDIRANNYSTLATELDLIGYIECVGNDRTISFNPTSKHDGKNTGGFDDLIMIPALKAGENNDFMKNVVLKRHFNMIQEKELKQKQVAEVFHQIDRLVECVVDKETADVFIIEIGELQHTGTSKEYAKSQFSKKIKQLGLQYDKDTKQYK